MFDPALEEFNNWRYANLDFSVIRKTFINLNKSPRHFLEISRWSWLFFGVIYDNFWRALKLVQHRGSNHSAWLCRSSSRLIYRYFGFVACFLSFYLNLIMFRYVLALHSILFNTLMSSFENKDFFKLVQQEQTILVLHWLQRKLLYYTS